MTALLAKLLITACLVVTACGLFIQDWNETHVYNPRWPPHARFHTVTGIVMNCCFSLASLYQLWLLKATVASVLLASLTPVFCWGSFFVAALVSSTAIEDVPGEVPRWFSIPINMLFPGLFSCLSLAGFFLYYSTTR